MAQFSRPPLRQYGGPNYPVSLINCESVTDSFLITSIIKAYHKVQKIDAHILFFAIFRFQFTLNFRIAA